VCIKLTLVTCLQEPRFTFHRRIISLPSHEQRRSAFLGWKSSDITCSECPESLNNDLFGYTMKQKKIQWKNNVNESANRKEKIKVKRRWKWSVIDKKKVTRAYSVCIPYSYRFIKGRCRKYIWAWSKPNICNEKWMCFLSSTTFKSFHVPNKNLSSETIISSEHKGKCRQWLRKIN
jgi:hypothetical protein